MEDNRFEKQTEKIFFGVLFSSNTLKRIIKAGLCIFFAAVLGFTILFQTKGISWLFEINYNFLRYIPAFMAFLALVGGFIFLKNKKPQNKGNTITPAQIDALLRTNNKLTANRLASAANTTVEYAKEVLDGMTADGKLRVFTEGYELVYSMPLIGGKNE